MNADASKLMRYARQVAFAPLGTAGQRSLLGGRVLIVGVGGLGTWTANFLARAGVGFLRLVDADKVDLTNIHRQALYDESDAARSLPKVAAATRRLEKINSDITIEPIPQRLEKTNIEALTQDVDLILDGTDNFPTRFLINDYAVKYNRPWIFAGVVGAEAQTMTILPNRTPCLRCVYESPPPPCVDPTCRSEGVLGPVVAAIASIQATEAIKILSGIVDTVSPYLYKLDLWTNAFQRIDVAQSCANINCPCCKRKDFEFLEA